MRATSSTRNGRSRLPPPSDACRIAATSRARLGELCARLANQSAKALSTSAARFIKVSEILTFIGRASPELRGLVKPQGRGDTRAAQAKFCCQSRFAMRLVGLVLLCLAQGVHPARAAETPATPGLRVTLSGFGDARMTAQLEPLARLKSGLSPVPAAVALRRLAAVDAAALRDGLVSLGHLEASVSAKVTIDDANAAITFRAEPGPLYKITNARIDYLDDAVPGEAPRPATLAAADLTAPPTAVGTALDMLEAQFVRTLQNLGYPLAQSDGILVETDFAQPEGTIVLPIRSGPALRISGINVEGTDHLDKDYIISLWRHPDASVYRQDDVDAYRALLIETGLFSELSVSIDPPQPDGTAPLRVSIKERKHRTFGAGVSFETDVGAGASLFWQNRNLTGSGETLSAVMSFAAPRQIVDLRFERPLVRLPGTLDVSLLAENETSDAFTARSLTVGAIVTRGRRRDLWRVSGGIQYKQSEIEDFDGTQERFFSAVVPTALTYAPEDDPLDPTAGFRLQLAADSFFGSTTFSRLDASIATRISRGSASERTTFAVRGRIGQIVGASADEVPAPERFFAGGGGSVRGYGFQLAGPVDAAGRPTGGTALAEIGVEARRAIGERFEGAIFLDGGNVFAGGEEGNDFASQSLLFGGGVGLRYRTPIGPLRIDLATPLTAREGIDDSPVQVYIALGQPF